MCDVSVRHKTAVPFRQSLWYFHLSLADLKTQYQSSKIQENMNPLIIFDAFNSTDMFGINKNIVTFHTNCAFDF